ncbi:lamin tail domain-containing protein [Rhodoferax sp. GW822-FHT02A01]|uniref:lamin tail domain-containing protein n=1 Tax=Rhodoferax sp. GW822-FHT02A01 TaxID=3141537 RepID=UPI00315D75B9
MFSLKKSLLGWAATGLVFCAMSAQAQVRITEVAPWSSSNSTVAADWFEMTNFGSTAVSIAGWKMDDDSASFSSAVALNGVTTINAGQSVIFVEGGATQVTALKNDWLTGSTPIGYYSGSGVGLSTTSDQVNIFDNTGTLQAKVIFGASDATSPYQTFDNAAGLNGVTISQLSQVGINGAHTAVSGTEIGSPGSIAAVPENETFAMLLAGLGIVGAIARRRRS